ncbi:hypothetical protein [Mycoplasma phocimorsus]|uniref:hypothetical protein n=1 Tax=Mycoplasma phocimorsus TaxID=3045839 RepID=UPI0024BF6D44|nr:hypothetical protein [Mycoplasma phocimorsus]MDJ1646290.1 hypothetical protein [Mycoplasma phocimorsus]
MDVSKSVDITLKAPINKENNSDKIQTWPFDIKDFSNKNNKLTIYRINDYTYNTKTKKSWTKIRSNSARSSNVD